MSIAVQNQCLLIIHYTNWHNVTGMYGQILLSINTEYILSIRIVLCLTKMFKRVKFDQPFEQLRSLIQPMKAKEAKFLEPATFAQEY